MKRAMRKKTFELKDFSRRVPSKDEKRVCTRETRSQCEHIFMNCHEGDSKVSEQDRE